MPVATFQPSTLVEVLAENESSEGSESLSDDNESQDTASTPVSEEQMLLQLLRMPGLLALLRMIAALTGLLGFLSQTPVASIVVNDTKAGEETLKASSEEATKSKRRRPLDDMLLEAAGMEETTIENMRQQHVGRRRGSQRGQRVAKGGIAG